MTPELRSFPEAMTAPQIDPLPSQGNDLLTRWERWWTGLDGTAGEIVWNAAPEDLAADLGLSQPWFRDLPVADLGCGNGRQTMFLASIVQQGRI